MGLLDDAIREHLDLKRRRGADPTEIERAEREALGPVRRGPEVTGEDLAPAEPAVEPDAGNPPESAEQWEPFQEDPELQRLEEHEELPPHEPARAPGGDPLMENEPFAGETGEGLPPHPADLAAEPDPQADFPPHTADPPSPPPPVAPHIDESPPNLEQETEEYEVETEEATDDDVLETTPEFLQDAPEHDRLWFEQRPPRDFDFDG
jgi:hypothetical protein